ncbi:hypothetical protein ACWDTI_25415 [Gordonia sp. NPDC003424]
MSTLDSTRLADIAGRQLECGVPADTPFLLVDLADDGMLISAVDPGEGVVVDQRVLWGVHPLALDQSLAEHLVRVGRVDAPLTDTWWNELLDLADRGRVRLASADGTFVMGHGDVPFFRVAQRDLDEATAPAAAEVSDVLREMSNDFAATSVFLGYDHADWPGLAPVLSRSVGLPVVEAPVDLADDDLGDIDQSDDAAQPSEPAPLATTASEPSYLPEPSGTPRTADAPAQASPRTRAASARTPGSSTRRPGKRLLIAIAAAAVVIVVGTATALAITGDDAPPPITALTEPSTTVAPPSPTYADPADFAAARVPAVHYTPPPPPPETSETTTGGGGQQQQGAPRQNRPQPAPRGRSIPNPIPGLPPIVIPPLPGPG